MEVNASLATTPKPRKTLPKGDCPVSFCLSKIGGKWKPLLIYMIRNDVNRFGKLYKAIPGISKQMLTKQLRELESDGIISRKVYPEVPPRVVYSITSYGESLFPVIDSMQKWGKKQMGQYRVV